MPYAVVWPTMLVRLPTLVLVTLGLGLVAACGSKTFDSVESGGAAGKGGSDGGSGASDPKGGSGGTTSGSSGDAGKGVGGTGRGGTSNGGTGAGGTDVGGASGTGGSRGGTGGIGGTTAGSGGSTAGTGGSVAGAGGSVAGAGGSLGGTGGCGVCPRVACLPPITITVTASGGIAALKGQVESNTTGTTLGDLLCSPSGPAGSCSWSCQFLQFQIPNGDYTIVLSAPGYEDKSVDFTVTQPTNCGCCGCGCGIGYQGTTTLEPDGSGTPECCSTLVTDTTNCGACGHACEAGQACSNGECVDPCLPEGSGCDGAGATCCGTLFCCSGAGGAPRFCYSTCPQ